MADAQCEQMETDTVSIPSISFETKFNDFVGNVRFLIAPQSKKDFERRVKEFQQKNFEKHDQPPASKVQLKVQLSQDVNLEVDTQDIHDELADMKKTKKNSFNAKVLKKLEAGRSDESVSFPALPPTCSLKEIIADCNVTFERIDTLNRDLITHQFLLGQKLKYLKNFCTENSIIFINFIQKYFIGRSLSTINKYINLYSFVKQFPGVTKCKLSMREILGSKKIIADFYKK